MHIQTPDIVSFHRALTDYYYQSGRRDMPWRKAEADGLFDPYKILVSEMMLQQTQVDRVTPKYHAFLRRFPNAASLAAAPLGDVLEEWSGLGYNRRAKFLWQAAGVVQAEYKGTFPQTRAGLEHLPGIGPNTAGAILAYAFNQPVVYLETNIRTVIIHHFFQDKQSIPDKAIREVLEILLPASGDKQTAQMHGSKLGPREFYWAMMDYGSYLKKTVGNLNRASKSYAKQSAFHGSLRQVRGAVLRQLKAGPQTGKQLAEHITDERLNAVLDALVTEGMISKQGASYRLG